MYHGTYTVNTPIIASLLRQLFLYSRPGSSGIPLTATKQTQFKPLSLDDNILDMIYESREVSMLQS